MDTTPEYIDMCRKAKELQDNHAWNPGDFYSIVAVPCEMICGGFERPFDGAIWLPRIDQLITLLNTVQIEELHNAGKHFTKHNELDTLGSIFHNCEVGDYYDTETSTVEQLFLVAFYSTKYEKIWNGEDWI